MRESRRRRMVPVRLIALALGAAGLLAGWAAGNGTPREVSVAPASPADSAASVGASAAAADSARAPAESTSVGADTLAGDSGVPPGRHPAIAVGEKLTFTVRYGLIKAGTAVMEIADMMLVDGQPAFKVVSTAASNPMFDGIYRVRDRVLSMMDAERLESLYFEKHLREGKYRADQRVRFDRKRRVAVYHDNQEWPIEPETFDVLAAFYRVRTMPLRPGETVYLTSHENRKNYPIKVTVLGRERVETPAGTFDCVVLNPTLRSGAFFKNEGRLTIWLTDDDRRMPVLMRSKLPIGAISVELIESERPERAAPQPAGAEGAVR